MQRDNIKAIVRAMKRLHSAGRHHLRDTTDAPLTHRLVVNTQISSIVAAEALADMLAAFNAYQDDVQARIGRHVEMALRLDSDAKASRSARALALMSAKSQALEHQGMQGVVRAFERGYRDLHRNNDRHFGKQSIEEVWTSLPGVAGAIGPLRSLHKVLTTRKHDARKPADFERRQSWMTIHLQQAAIDAIWLEGYLRWYVGIKNPRKARRAPFTRSCAEAEFLKRFDYWLGQTRRAERSIA